MEDEGEASYLDSGLIIGSNDGGPEDSVSELVGLMDGVGMVGGDMVGESLFCQGTLAMSYDISVRGQLPADGCLGFWLLSYSGLDCWDHHPF